jgi:hypothetical protein
MISKEKMRREFISPRKGMGIGDVPCKVPAGRFLWHNHIQHCEAMPQGLHGFRYWHAKLPVDYRQFMRCQCGVVDLPHYIRRGAVKQKCVSEERVLTNDGMTAKQARKKVREGWRHEL